MYIIMIGEPTHIALEWKEWCQAYSFHLNMHPNYQLLNYQSGLGCYIALQMKTTRRKDLYNQSESSDDSRQTYSRCQQR